MSGATVLDSSALLAWLQAEDGAHVVEERLLAASATIGAANWSEVAQKVTAGGGSWPLARALLDSYDVVVAPVTREDGERAAELWERGAGLSIADRLCLALAERTEADALTADTAWTTHPRSVMIR